MNLPPSHGITLSLYREYLRQIRHLPHLYLRQFFRLKVSDDIRAISRTSTFAGLRDRKFKRVSKDLRKIKAANTGGTKAFAHVLDLAYGRKGKLKWELMEAILSDPKAPIPSRIIHAEEKSRPPVYSPELKALLTSGYSRTTKALQPRSLTLPPKLPLRADPCSDEASLLGQFSKRREVNIRWRYFVTEWKKVRPPLQVVVKDISDMVYNGVAKGVVCRAGIRGLGMQGFGVFEEIKTLIGPPWIPKTPAHRQQEIQEKTSDDSTSHSPRHPCRWLRRRYQELLGRMPILTFSGRARNGRSVGRYSVSLSRRAIAPSQRYSADRLAEVDPLDLAWLGQADSQDKKAGLFSPNSRINAVK